MENKQALTLWEANIDRIMGIFQGALVNGGDTENVLEKGAHRITSLA